MQGFLDRRMSTLLDNQPDTLIATSLFRAIQILTKEVVSAPSECCLSSESLVRLSWAWKICVSLLSSDLEIRSVKFWNES